MLVLIIHFFSLNFISIEIEGERVSSSQNERTLGGRGVLEQGGKGGVKTRESWAKVLFECPLSQLQPHDKKYTLIECYFKQKQIQKERNDMIMPNIRL